MVGPNANGMVYRATTAFAALLRFVAGQSARAGPQAVSPEFLAKMDMEE